MKAVSYHIASENANIVSFPKLLYHASLIEAYNLIWNSLIEITFHVI